MSKDKEQLQADAVAACGRLEAFCSIEPETVADGVQLAERLQGVARAVSAVVMRVGWAEPSPTDQLLPELADIWPASADPYERYVVRTPAVYGPQAGKVFFARSLDYYGVRMGIHHEAITSAHDVVRPTEVTHDIMIPSDRAIDTLLSQEPCFWDNADDYARDVRSGEVNVAYPFSSRYFTHNAAASYLDVAQDLSDQLLHVVGWRPGTSQVLS
jgi:hypothetical protein